MNILSNKYKTDLLKGCEIKFNKKMEATGIINVTKINNQLYGVKVTDNMVVIQHYDENMAFVYVFESPNDEEVFTRYKFKRSDEGLIVIGSTYSVKDNKPNVRSMGSYLVALENNCLNKIIYFADKYVSASPIETLKKILGNKEVDLVHFVKDDEIETEEKNPYKIINMSTNNLTNEIIKRRTR